MSVEAHRAHDPGPLGFAVLTVSDTRTAATDRGGPRVRALLEAAGHRVVDSGIARDEVEAIRAAVRAALARDDCDVVVLTGGTGVAPCDVTPEALAPLLERRLDGFGELFRALSFQAIGPAAMLSRATAGTNGRRALFALPGSPAAVELAITRLVLPEIGHLLAQLRRS